MYVTKILLSSVDDIGVFKEKFRPPLTTFLSQDIFVFIEDLIYKHSEENTKCLLPQYLKSMYHILDKFDDKYKRYGLLCYVEDIIVGTKSFDQCCSEIYANVFVKIHLLKCDQFNKRSHKGLEKDLGGIIGKEFKGIIKEKLVFPLNKRKN